MCINSFNSERQLGQKTLQSYAKNYDERLLSRIGGPDSTGPSTPTRTTAPPLSASSRESTSSSFHKLSNGDLKPLSMPTRLQPSKESPVTRMAHKGSISSLYSGLRSPNGYENDLHQRRLGSISTTGPLDEALSTPPHRGSYDHSIISEHDFVMEDSGMRDLNLNDRKRRASSPPSEIAREDRPPSNHNVDLHPRQRLRNSPIVSRFPSANPGSLSSVSSLGQRNASYASSYAFSGASSMTSYNGDQRLSPSALSPSTETESGPVSPYTYNRSRNPSPRSSLSVAHQHGWPEYELGVRKMSTAESVLHSRQNSVSSRMTDYLTCQCCPKKPKKFTSEEELR